MKLVDFAMDGSARPLDPGMGVAIGRRTVFRPEDHEDMGRVADRVAAGNLLLDTTVYEDFNVLKGAIASGALITSGRHLQHGDPGQPTRPFEVFSNCSTAAASFLKFYLLLNGSGVGRSYNDELMLVNWAYAPDIYLMLNWSHKDFPRSRKQLEEFSQEFEIPTVTSIVDNHFVIETDLVRNWLNTHIHTTMPTHENVVYVRVEDSREGWTRAMEVYETMTFNKANDMLLVLDFSDVRPCGAPIAGMQNRPASGPLSVMRAFLNIHERVVKLARLASAETGGWVPDGPWTWPWYQAMHVDHHLSVEVQVGGARRAARMSTKDWRDPQILEFISIKNDCGLWTSNNSVVVDDEFWDAVRMNQGWATEIFNAIVENAYLNGEPGFINGHKLWDNSAAARKKTITQKVGNKRYRVSVGEPFLDAVETVGLGMRYPAITNPCGEISILATGGYCVLADVAPLLAAPTYDIPNIEVSDTVACQWDENFVEAVKLAARFLIRVNLMDSLYHQEVERTNRIGVSLTGLLSFGWKRFNLDFMDLLDESRSILFWSLIEHASMACKEEAFSYSERLKVARPETVTTIKPSGSVSKLYGLEEGAHLPARRQYIRWVQMRGQKRADGTWPTDADPLLARYEAMGYPVKTLNTFKGMSIVGFPTLPLPTRLGVPYTVRDVTPEQQYRWLQLLEKHWIGEEHGSQVSYTMKIDTSEWTLERFRKLVLEFQPTVRCCTILPTNSDDHAMGYEYLPEQEVSVEQFHAISSRIHDDSFEDIDMEALKCASGACPI